MKLPSLLKNDIDSILAFEKSARDYEKWEKEQRQLAAVGGNEGLSQKVAYLERASIALTGWAH
jgi:hypothetical protein